MTETEETIFIKVLARREANRIVALVEEIRLREGWNDLNKMSQCDLHFIEIHAKVILRYTDDSEYVRGC